MARKRKVDLREAIRCHLWKAFANYASRRGKFSGRPAGVILPVLLAVVSESALPGSALVEMVLDFLEIEPMDLL